MTESNTALLLIAHGSRLRTANADLEHLASELRARASYLRVQPAYLELCEPSIDQGAEVCVESGASRVVLLPYFLSAGIHVRDDLTEARDRLAERFGNVQFVLAEPLGRHPMLTDIVLQRATESLAG